MKRMSFLLGSGVSKPEEMPMIDCLDCRIKRGDYGHRVVDDGVHYFEERHESSQHVERLQRFICELWKVVAELIEETDKRRPSRPTGEESFPRGEPRRTNYEDVSLALNQLIAFANGSGGAAETALFCKIQESRKLISAARAVCRDRGDGLRSAIFGSAKDEEVDTATRMQFASNEALKLCRFAVASALVHRKNPNKSNYQPLIDALDDESSEVPGIITLNHDLILEDVLDAHPAFCHEYGLVDGFELADKNGIRKYNPDLLYQDHEVPLLIKPHGSISWWKEKTSVGQSSPVHAVSSKKAKDRLQTAPKRSIGPVFLKDAGKQEFYSQSIWQEMHQAFRRVLQTTNVVVVSGYGFGDSGINEVIFSWLRQEENRIAAILHEKGNEMTDNRFRFLAYRRKISFVKKWFCDATLEDVLKAMNES